MKIEEPKINKSHGTGEFQLKNFRRLGKGVVFERRVIDFYPENIEIGDNVNIGHYNSVAELVNEHLSSKVNRRLFIWSLINFEWWAKLFKQENN